MDKFKQFSSKSYKVMTSIKEFNEKKRALLKRMSKEERREFSIKNNIEINKTLAYIGECYKLNKKREYPICMCDDGIIRTLFDQSQ